MYTEGTMVGLYSVPSMILTPGSFALGLDINAKGGNKRSRRPTSEAVKYSSYSLSSPLPTRGRSCFTKTVLNPLVRCKISGTGFHHG